MNSEFKFNTQQINTLNRSGLAAYVQRPPKDRVGWVYASGVWLPDWKPKKWAIQVQHIEVTLNSFNTVEEYSGQSWDFEPLEHLMVTAQESFLTDQVQEVEHFFSLYIDKAEFARHPSNVQFPDEFRTPDQKADREPAREQLTQRALVHTLIKIKEAESHIVWESERLRAIGFIERIDLQQVTISTIETRLTLWISPNGLRVSAISTDLTLKQYWPTHQTVPISELPVWDHAQEQWLYLRC